MKLFHINISTRIFHALFGWSLCLPSRGEIPQKPFEGKITSNESEDESWADPLEVTEDSILRATDPLLMTRSECHESTVRYWMECKGYDRKDIEKPLTDERYREISRKPFKEHYEFQESNRKKVFKKFPEFVHPIVDTRKVGLGQSGEANEGSSTKAL